LVSARTLFAAGLALIAIVSLATVVIVQLMALQSISGHTETQFSIVTHEQLFYVTQTLPQWATQTVTEQATTVQRQTQTSNIPAGTPYVLIRYYGWRDSSLFGCNPSSGNEFLAVNITIQNHGYDSVYVNPFDFYAVIGNNQYRVSFFSSCVGNELSSAPSSVLNGLSVTGWVVYEVPSNFDYEAFHLLCDHPNNVSVQYEKA
jgi:hypothetical protein